MVNDSAVKRLSALLRKLREDRRISLRQLADEAGVSPSVAHRAERGEDARLSTWEKLFEGLGCRLDWVVAESSEEAPDLIAEEAQARRDRQWEGLCAGKRRFFR